MNAWWQLGGLWLFAATLMSAGWAWQRAHTNAGIVDVLWAAGLGCAALWFAWLGDGALWPRLSMGLLGAVWSARLAIHLYSRVRGEQEDGRYQELRAHWHGSQWRFFAFFQFQAALIVLFAVPFLVVAGNRTVQGPWLVAGLLIWLLSVSGESIADRQLARFRARGGHQGRTCREGLWHYSRHPNYFFEWLHWFSYVCLAIGAPMAWLAWSGPVVMYVFLRWISGVPHTERHALRSRGEDYRDYQRTTSMLFPWFPKRS